MQDETLTYEQISSPLKDKRPQQVLKSASGFIGKSAAVTALSALATIVSIRLMGPAESGKLNYVLQITGMMGLFLSMASFETLAKFMPSATEPQRHRLCAQALTAFGVILALEALCLIGMKLWGWSLPGEIEELLIPIATMTVFSGLLTLNLGLLRGVGRFSDLPAVSLMTEFAPKLLAVAILFAGFRNYQAVFLPSLILTVVAFFWTLRSTWSHLGPFGFAKPERRVFIYWASCLAGSVAYMLCTSVDVLVVRALLDPVAVGLFTAGVRIPQLTQTVLLSRAQVPFLYFFTADDTRDLREVIFEKGTRYFGAAMGIIALALIIVAKPLVHLLLGGQFDVSASVTSIYALVLFAIGIQTLAGSYLNALDLPLITPVLSVLAFTVSFLLDMLLVPRYGIQGAAMAAVAAASLQTLAVMAFIHVRLHVRLLPQVVILASAMALSVFVGMVANFWLSPVVFLTGLLLTGTIQWAEMQEGFRMLVRRR